MHLRERAYKVLRAGGAFGGLEETVLQDLASLLTFKSVQGGFMLLREGEPSIDMLFVMSGGLRVSRRNALGQVDLYNEVRPGQSIGEAGLILQQPRTADVTAMRDSTLAVLSRANFETLLIRYPLALSRVFVQSSFHFARNTRTVVEQRYAQAFVVIGLHGGADIGTVANGLAAALGQRGRVHHFKPPQVDAEESAAMVTDIDADRQNALDEQFDFLLYEAGADVSPWTQHAFRQADQVVFVASVGAAQALGKIERGLMQELGFDMKRKHLVLLHPATASQPSTVAAWRDTLRFERVYPLRTQHEGDFSRLARFLTGSAVGVVLGGGGARGFAHLGVLRALEEAGVAIDLVGGNSMGALIGAQYVSGVSLDEILTRTQRFAAGGEHLTLPLISLVSGRRVERDLKRMFGDTEIEGLWRPYFAAACNLTRGITSIQESGPLWRAVLASNSPAGLFPPVLHQGELLVDGAILDNVPIEAMRQRLGTALEKRHGNGTIIAIDVDVPDALGADPALARLSPWQAIKSYFLPGAHPSPGIGDILYSAGHVGSVSQRGRTKAQADHYLEPPVAGFSLMGYRHAHAIAEVGYRYAEGIIAQWKQQTSAPWDPGK
ncbi:MAG: cyclic nucleotide-binding and patatin-like phospholipase domain-containing protein [Rhodoferax sp.]